MTTAARNAFIVTSHRLFLLCTSVSCQLIYLSNIHFYTSSGPHTQENSFQIRPSIMHAFQIYESQAFEFWTNERTSHCRFCIIFFSSPQRPDQLWGPEVTSSYYRRQDWSSYHSTPSYTFIV
jgi:hypothetical protein